MKVKKGTRESGFAAAERFDITAYGRGGCNLGMIGERGAILATKCFEGDLANFGL